MAEDAVASVASTSTTEREEPRRSTDVGSSGGGLSAGGDASVDHEEAVEPNEDRAALEIESPC